MQLRFLGTAAAEGYPGLFCNCANCREARALGGKNIRFRSALLVDRHFLIDFGPDLLGAAFRFNLSLWDITTGLITHAHSDHFNLDCFEMREDPFTGNQPIPTLNLYAPPDAAAMIHAKYPDLSALRLNVKSVGPFETWEDHGYQITSYRAYHAVGSLDCLFYSVGDGKKNFLYATDTGNFPDETWQALAGRVFDSIILEETLGEDGSYAMHLGFEGFLDHVRRMRSMGMLKPGGRIIAHHLSHSGNPTHEKTEKILGPHGVEVAYDGMLVDLN